MRSRSPTVCMTVCMSLCRSAPPWPGRMNGRCQTRVGHSGPAGEHSHQIRARSPVSCPCRWGRRAFRARSGPYWTGDRTAGRQCESTMTRTAGGRPYRRADRLAGPTQPRNDFGRHGAQIATFTKHFLIFIHLTNKAKVCRLGLIYSVRSSRVE